jgi:hypothetical protein
MARNAKQIALTRALLDSRKAAARLQGMKQRTELDPPRACIGTFPFGYSRTCAEWEMTPRGKVIEREMTDEEREKDAREGSAKLRDAILAIAA